MNIVSSIGGKGGAIPAWLPDAARHYLAHTEAGLPIRELARRSGVHASTVLRQIRRFEARRDDPLIDAALRNIGAGITAQTASQPNSATQELLNMSAHPQKVDDPIVPGDDSLDFQRDALRVLRRLCETGAVLAVAADLQTAVIVREGANGTSTRTGTVDRAAAEVMALRDWIATNSSGRVCKYHITGQGRRALDALFETLDDAWDCDPEHSQGDDIADQHRVWGEKTIVDADTGGSRRVRYNAAESPLTALARRKDRDGTPFLNDDLVRAGERLREDFELAHMGPRVAQNWDRFLTAGTRGGFGADSGIGNGPDRARRRVADALSTLGPGLGDVALRCCCYLEGMETAEKRLGWSARSGKIVLRIALMQLLRHYEETTGPGGGLIG